MILSITDAARCLNVTRQAIHVAIRQKKLRASKEGYQWRIDLKDLQQYEFMRWSRDLSIYDGRPLYDKSEGEYSVKQAAEKLGMPFQHVYYAARLGRIKSFRKGNAIVIKEQDIENYRREKSVRKRGWIINIGDVYAKVI
ncbi:MAG TPA: helix-turn-helix domain-containing protein [Candidatus Nitrosotenuis sp.]|nr:helix-turn-helix domain-containing protein [Candidatus Nitrosotenuis sp.]